VLQPGLFKVFFGIFALKEVPEKKLVFVDRLLGDY